MSFSRDSHRSWFYKCFSCLLALCFLLTSFMPSIAAAQMLAGMLNLPTPGVMLGVSPIYTPALLNGLTIDPQDPMHFEFIITPGDSTLSGDALKQESQKLVRYFLTSMTVPEKDLWVNLSPFERDRIVPASFGQTEMGRDLLAQDYILKQLTSSLMFPEGELGQKFWRKIKQQAKSQYGMTDIPTDVFNKVWITPDKVTIYERGNSAFVASARLKVLLDTDYFAMQATRGMDNSTKSVTQEKSQPALDLTSELIREIIIPEIEKEVNTGENFAQLRQVYHSLILASWFKKTFRDSYMGQLYVNKNKIAGVDLEDKDAKYHIYEQYVEAYHKGVYNYIKEEYDPASQQMLPKKYFSGGVDSAMLVVDQNGNSQFRDGVLVSQGTNVAQQIFQKLKEPVKFDVQFSALEKEPDAAMLAKTGSTRAAVSRELNILLQTAHSSVENINAELAMAKALLVADDIIEVELMTTQNDVLKLHVPLIEDQEMMDAIYVNYIAKMYARSWAMGHGPNKELFVGVQDLKDLRLNNIELDIIKAIENYFSQLGSAFSSKVNAGGDAVQVLSMAKSRPDSISLNAVQTKPIDYDAYKDLIKIGFDVSGRGFKVALIQNGNDITNRVLGLDIERQKDQSLYYRYAFDFEHIEQGGDGEELKARLVAFVNDVVATVENKAGRVGSVFMGLPGALGLDGKFASFGDLTRNAGFDENKKLDIIKKGNEALAEIKASFNDDVQFTLGNNSISRAFALVDRSGFKGERVGIIVPGSGIAVNMIGEDGQNMAIINEGGHQIYDIGDNIASLSGDSPLGSFEDAGGSARGIKAMAVKRGVMESLEKLLNRDADKIEVKHIASVAKGINPLTGSTVSDELKKISLNVFDEVSKVEAQHMIHIHRLTGANKFVYAGGTTAGDTGEIRRDFIQAHLNQYWVSLNKVYRQLEAKQGIKIDRFKQPIELKLIQSADAAYGAALKAQQVVTDPHSNIDQAMTVEEQRREKKLLIAEADEYFGLILYEHFAALGYQISLVNDGKQALDLSTQQTYDLIITGYDMPYMDGSVLIENLEKEFVETPVFMFTASQPMIKEMNSRTDELRNFKLAIDKNNIERLQLAVDQTLDIKDQAMTVEEVVGGIQFDPSLIDMSVERDQDSVPINFDMQNLPQININTFEGLQINVINMIPANLPLILGLYHSSEDVDQVSGLSRNLFEIADIRKDSFYLKEDC